MIPENRQAQYLPAPLSQKPLGGHLIDAGLLTLDQVNVALVDQSATGMRFGEVLVIRGWLKEQTVEWIVTKVSEAERRFLEAQTRSLGAIAPKPRRDLPIAKALPSVNSVDNDVCWVG
jgi:hypothetical protein